MTAPGPPSRFALVTAAPVAVLLAALSLGGLVTSAYAREAPAWTAQAVGQDWFDLVVAAPWIAVCAVGARRGSVRWTVLLAGAYAYTAYEAVIYAFAIHFNRLFLLYCATLGLSGYALVALAVGASAQRGSIDRGAARLVAGFLVVLGVVFAVMWLAEDVPAMLRGEPSPSLRDTGLFTNPVHVIDLAFVLPAHGIAGVLLWRQRPAGALVAPIVLAFGVLMSASIGGMLLVIRIRGDATATPVMIAMFAITAATAAALRYVLAHRRPAQVARV